jgi:hypothetical protein
MRCLTVFNMGPYAILLQFLQQFYNTTTGQYTAGRQPAIHILNKTDNQRRVIVVCTDEPCYWNEAAAAGAPSVNSQPGTRKI